MQSGEGDHGDGADAEGDPEIGVGHADDAAEEPFIELLAHVEIFKDEHAAGKGGGVEHAHGGVLIQARGAGQEDGTEANDEGREDGTDQCAPLREPRDQHGEGNAGQQ